MSTNPASKRQKLTSNLELNGITHTLSPTSCRAVLKERYSDFIVNEISHSKVMKLTSLDAPTPVQPIDSQDFIANMSNHVSAELATQISLLPGTNERCSLETIVIEDKPTRALIHNLIRAFGGIDSKTLADNTITFVPAKKMKINWKELGGDYVHFIMYKENRESLDALGEIAKKCHIPMKSFNIAGNKDKRGITSQLVSGYRVNAKRIVEAINGSKQWDISDKQYGIIRVGNFSYSETDLKLGDLKGNRFKVTLRQVQTESLEKVADCIRSLEKSGFVNYFGLQRFGTTSVPTHLVGIALLNGKFNEAVNLILKPKLDEREKICIARAHWVEHQDAEKALELFPRSCVAERAILTCFSKTGKTRHALTSLSKIPKNLRLMYLHAYQSFIWNHMASKRLELYGHVTPIVGDLVLVDVPEAGSKTTGGSKPQHALLISESNISKFTIDNVVLPLPGWDILYPENLVGHEYQKLMGQDGIDWKDMKRKERDHSLPGAYRYIISTIRNFASRIIRYNDNQIPLCVSDIDEVAGRVAPDSIEGAEHIGIVLEFDLESSCYATMAIREVAQCEGFAVGEEALLAVEESV